MFVPVTLQIYNSMNYADFLNNYRYLLKKTLAPLLGSSADVILFVNKGYVPHFFSCPKKFQVLKNKTAEGVILAFGNQATFTFLSLPGRKSVFFVFHQENPAVSPVI